jgi:RimJ/RimL family protein N-acetyltransferase
MFRLAFHLRKIVPLLGALALLSNPSTAWSADAPLERVAMGSCNKQDQPQPLWKPILGFRPQLWIWLGDNIYGDTTDMSKLARKYSEQKSNPGYRKLLARISGDQPASLGLHTALGFKEAGRLRGAGHKLGQWLDCVYLELDLVEPQP